MRIASVADVKAKFSGYIKETNKAQSWLLRTVSQSLCCCR